MRVEHHHLLSLSFASNHVINGTSAPTSQQSGSGRVGGTNNVGQSGLSHWRTHIQQGLLWEYLVVVVTTSLSPSIPTQLGNSRPSHYSNLSLVLSLFAKMRYTDALGLTLSVLGAYGLVWNLRFLLPRHLIPLVSAQLDEIAATLDHTEADALPTANEYRIDVAILRNQLLQLRTASHRSPWFCQQLGLAVLSGLTWRVYTLHSQIADLRRELEMAMDEHQRAPLATVSSAQSAATTATPAAIVAAPMANVAELPSPPPAAVIRPTHHYPY